MLDEQVVVAVVVEHAHAGGMRARSDDHIGGRQAVMTDLGELALRIERNGFDFGVDLNSRER